MHVEPFFKIQNIANRKSEKKDGFFDFYVK
jgi:hypothetical protein